MPGGRTQMLRVLTGTRSGLFGTVGLEDAFVESLMVAGAGNDAGDVSPLRAMAPTTGTI